VIQYIKKYIYIYKNFFYFIKCGLDVDKSIKK